MPHSILEAHDDADEKEEEDDEDEEEFEFPPPPPPPPTNCGRAATRGPGRRRRKGSRCSGLERESIAAPRKPRRRARRRSRAAAASLRKAEISGVFFVEEVEVDDELAIDAIANRPLLLSPLLLSPAPSDGFASRAPPRERSPLRSPSLSDEGSAELALETARRRMVWF